MIWTDSPIAIPTLAKTISGLGLGGRHQTKYLLSIKS